MITVQRKFLKESIIGVNYLYNRNILVKYVFLDLS